MQLGFVIDQSRCIGCHACTVACKAENHIPLGSFRTWVKYTERGEFPEVRRSFGVLRCNQCSAAPCVEICPVRALHKRDDGVVDIDSGVCIGCKGCMQACPYDALYLHPETGLAEKCHFCVHRTERGLAPACAVVCPTEAILPGDFHDPDSLVSRMLTAGDLVARKVEAGTSPNVYYRAADAAVLDPALTSATGGYLWSNALATPQMEAELFEAMERRAEARTVYDVDHAPHWGGRVSAYVFTKSLAAGIFLAGALTGLLERIPVAVALVSMLFLVATTALLIADLKRPERFLLIVRRPNWSSWIARGALALLAYAALLTAWIALGLTGRALPAWGRATLVAATSLAAALTAAYTAWLFAQAKGRPLWMKRGLALHLLAQALVAGAALLLVAGTRLAQLGEAQALAAGAAGAAGAAQEMAAALGRARRLLQLALVAHLAFVLLEGWLAPPARESEYRRAARLLSHGPYARRHWWGGVGIGVLAPLLLLVVAGSPLAGAAAGLLALGGLALEEDLFVQAGQALPIS